MAKYRRKLNMKGLISAIAVVAIVLGSLAGVVALTRNESKTISSTTFTRGALDSNGEYIESTQSIYTKDSFDCIGLRVEPDFEFKGKFDVYYYDKDNRLVEVKTGLVEVYDEDFPLAEKARVVIHPEIPADVKKDDFKIAFYEVYKYARQVKITVNKDQTTLYDFVNLFVEENATSGVSVKSELKAGTKFEISESAASGLMITDKIAVTEDYEKFDVFVRCTSVTSGMRTIGVFATSSEESLVASHNFNMGDVNDGEWVKITYEVPNSDEGIYLRVLLPVDADCYIYGYGD